VAGGTRQRNISGSRHKHLTLASGRVVRICDYEGLSCPRPRLSMRAPVLSVLFGSSLAAGLLAQPPTYRAEVSLVAVDTEVVDGARVIEGLGKEDFRIWDNEQEQQVADCYYAKEPLDVALLFDLSGSMRPNMERITESAEAALQELHAGDRVAVIAFAAKTRVLLPLSRDMAAVTAILRHELSTAEFGGTTRLLSGIDEAAKALVAEAKTRRRRAIIVFTDNYGLRTRRPGPIVTRLWEIDAVVNGLFIRDPRQVRVRKVTRFVIPSVYFLSQGMNGIVEKTGGTIVEVQDTPGSAFTDMMRRLRNRYVLYYAMPKGNSGDTRNVRVELSREARARYPDARVRARRGYHIPGGP
jgi:VWFA-related protein